ncbi:MAG TPA: response regulator [Roseomonas sp.]|nr:response regulator [Roseomonas sp.]
MDSQTTRIIALVDDDAGVRHSFRFLLETAGYAVETYESGQHFLAEAELPRLSCLLLDQKMPQLTGLEVLAKLRAVGMSTPALLVTDMLLPTLIRRAAELGASAVLEKPLTQDDLLARIEAVLSPPADSMAPPADLLRPSVEALRRHHRAG